MINITSSVANGKELVGKTTLHREPWILNQIMMDINKIQSALQAL